MVVAVAVFVVGRALLFPDRGSLNPHAAAFFFFFLRKIPSLAPGDFILLLLLLLGQHHFLFPKFGASFSGAHRRGHLREKGTHARPKAGRS